jgi:hypothetical protein
MSNDPQLIQKHLNTFHNLLIDVLRRRELFRIFEKNLVGKASENDVKENWFVSFHTTDYTREQVVDLRKFFESDPRSYKISFLTAAAGDEGLTQAYQKILQYWKNSFEAQANKIIMHLDQDSENLKKVIDKKTLDQFIDDLNIFFDSIVDSFRKGGATITYDEKYRSGNGEFLNAKARVEFDQYLQMSRDLPASKFSFLKVLQGLFKKRF